MKGERTLSNLPLLAMEQETVDSYLCDIACRLESVEVIEEAF